MSCADTPAESAATTIAAAAALRAARRIGAVKLR
jgi:hypothetical protein